jgi:hypothetical protein
MGSAFSPVKPKSRIASPPLTSDLNSGPGGESICPKRTRQGSSLKQKMMTLEDIDEDTLPDNMSVSVSEASTRGSIPSQPPLLDFVGAACCASSWFTGIFPCAILDINDSDDLVVDKLSRESAMNVMYSNDVDRTNESINHAREQDLNIMFIRVPTEETGDSLHSQPIPAVVEDESDGDEDDAIGKSSLNNDTYDTPVSTAPLAYKVFSLSPPKWTKFGMQKVFRRKRQ